MTTLVRWDALSIRSIVSAIAVYFFWKFDAQIKPETAISASGVIVGLAGTLLGFLITSISLLTALIDKKLIANMIKTSHYSRLISDTVLTCLFLIIVIIISIVTLLSHGKLVFCFFSSALFFTCLSFLYLIEAGRRFSVILIGLR